MNAANSLGARPGEGGMSTDTVPGNIQPHRRPVDFGGTQKNAGMFSTDSDELAAHGLTHDVDGKGSSTHVSIVTAEGVHPSELGSRLAKTKPLWKRVSPCG